MEPVDHASALITENDAFAALLRGADWTTEVPTCPGWTLLQVLRHVGRGHRWAAQMVAERATGPIDPREVRDGRPPDDEEGALDWFRQSAEAVLSAVTGVGADTPVWTFTGPRAAGWWVRRRLHEVTVHRADLALALGASYAVAPEVAVDGIEEWLHLVAARPRGADGVAALDDGATLALVTDEGLSWQAHGVPDGVGLEITGTAGATVTGPARDLLLALTRRSDGAGVRVDGDPTVWSRWLERTAF